MCCYHLIAGRLAAQGLNVSVLGSFPTSVILTVRMEKARLGISPEDKRQSAARGLVKN